MSPRPSSPPTPTGSRFPTTSPRWWRQGDLGRKSGRGFYLYEKGKTPEPTDPPNARVFTPPSEEIAERLASLLTEESHRCLAEGIAATANEVDLALVMGTGYAPFRGGPLGSEGGDR